MSFTESEKLIADAAGRAFDKFSIKKTSVEDICREAGISRPTFYRQFRNKEELIIRIAGNETMRLSENVARFCEKYSDIEDAFVEAMLLVTLESERSPVVRYLLAPENFEYTVSLVSHQPKLWSSQLRTWKQLYDKAREQGRLQPGLKADDVALWLSMIRMMFVVFSPAMKMDRRQIRRLIRTFVIRGILLPSST